MEYLNPLISEFTLSANALKALQMQNYMKGKFPFFGINAKERESIQNKFFAENGWPERTQLFKVVNYLWQLPEREFQHCAINILQKFKDKLDITDIQNIEYLIVEKSWWDTVDGLAAWICGSYFKNYPQKIKEVTAKWVMSDNIWLQRSTLLFQLKYKKQTDIDLLADYIVKLSGSKEFFIRKAIGWILREYSKTNPNWVRNFVKKNDLSGLSYREATKYV